MTETTSPDELLARLASLGIPVERHHHLPLRTVEESRRLRGQLRGGHSKNLFLKDKKKRLWLAVTLEDRRVDLGRLQRVIGSARLSFGRPERLMEALGIEPGAVSPFALVNDPDYRVTVVLDVAMMRLPLLNFHPLVNTQTLTIATEDLRRFLADCGHQVMEVEFPQRTING